MGGVSSQVSLSEISHHCVSWSSRRAIAALRWAAMIIFAKSIEHGAVGGKNRYLSTWMLTTCGVWLVGLGVYFIVFRPPLLPEDPRFIGTTLAQIQAAVPGLESWLKRVFTVLGGFMAGAGILTVFVATVAMPRRLKGASWAIALSGALTVVLMSATNFALHSDFKWLLLVPALVWLVGLFLYISGH